MPRVAIFVSHRIDLDSKLIKNPLYHHMRCGAVDDKRKGIRIAGDDTGDNISDKHDYINEFTVQYWAWKNYDADYYGLCHYRRYLSFADHEFPTKQFQGFIEEQKITWQAANKYRLDSPYKICSEVRKYDAVYCEPFAVENAPTRGSKYKNYQASLVLHRRTLITEEHIDLLKTIIRENYPRYYAALLERLQSEEVIGFNLFVMRKELFFQMCEFEFGVIEQLLNKIDVTKYEGNSIRLVGYLGEILYGTYIQWLIDEGSYRLAEKQAVLFYRPEKENGEKHMNFQEKSKNVLKKVFLKISPAYRTARRVEEKQQQLLASYRGINTMLNRIYQRQEMALWLSQPVFPDDLTQAKLRFWHSYPKAEGDLRLIQEGNMWMLHRLKAICDEIGVRFWLHGGSLVGGLRHDGYVPWDDDIDVGMMREDLLALMEALQKSDRYVIREFYYEVLTAKGYRFMRKDMPSNAFVDIFPYDYYCLTEEDVPHEWGKMIDYKLEMKRQFHDLVTDYGFVPQNRALEDMPDLKIRLDKLLNQYCERVASKEPSEWIVWGMDNNFGHPGMPCWRIGRVFQKSDIFPLQECTFEGEMMYAPHNIQKYIYAEYGLDYLDMPNDMNVSKHIKNYFSTSTDMDNLRVLVADEQGRGK